jgi:integrase
MTSRFADDVWDLKPALLQAHQISSVLDFTSLPPAYRLAAKELFLAMLAGEPPPGERVLGVSTVKGRFSDAKSFLEWVADRYPEERALRKLVPGDLEEYQRHLLDKGFVPSRRCVLRRGARMFWIYHGHLRTDRLMFDPERLEEWSEGNSKHRRRENSTARIPEQVIGPLLVWALRFVDQFSDDVLAALSEWLAGRVKAVRDAETGRVRRHEVLAVLLDRYRAAGRPLPGGRDGAVNIHQLARELNCWSSSLDTTVSRTLIEHAAAQLGVADRSYLWQPADTPLDGRPWWGPVALEDVEPMVRLLHTACYIVIAYLSGMRDSEIKHLQRGCLSADKDTTGRISRNRVTSQAFKGEGAVAGVTATWIVGAPVARAVAVLQQLQPADQAWLFALPPSSRSYSRARPNPAQSNMTTRYDLAFFATWVTDYCRQHGRADTIPTVSGQRFHLIPSQFRRTLAWFIGRRPGGTIAGAIQYRHHSIQMFEGYAGTSTSGFRAEAQQEAALARGEHLAVLVERHEHQQLSGPSAHEARDRLEEFGNRIRFMGKIPEDDTQLKKIMTRHDPHVFPGKYVTCADNPDRRLCRTPDFGGAGPDLDGCKPLACRNVALTPDNLASWRDELARLDGQLRRADAWAPLVHARLSWRRDQIAEFLERYADPPADRGTA